MSKKIRIPDMIPRDYQLPFFQAMDSGIKRAVLVHHRRAGKEVICWNYMIREACCGRVGTYCYFFPTSRLGKRILWDGANKEGRRFVDYIPKELIKSENSVEMKIELISGSVIQIMGTDQIINVGINPIGCVFSEFSLQDPKSWNFVRPILRENDGWAVMNGTPRGRNHFFELYRMAKDNPDWFCQKLSITDTGVLSEADIDAERKAGMSENLIQQEFYCSFTQGIDGSFYAKYLQQAEKDERVCNVPYDPYAAVDTYWDLGVSDSTAILFAQNIGQEIHVIDSYSNHGEGLDHYARVVEKKAQEGLWKYGTHYAPHDIRVRELGHGAKTRLQMARDLGLDFEVVPKLSINEGIEMTRSIWHKMWIDKKKCKLFLKSVENYHKVYNERLGIYSDKPLHDWSSNYCDALRYMAVMQSKSKRSTMTEGEANDFERLYANRY